MLNPISAYVLLLEFNIILYIVNWGDASFKRCNKMQRIIDIHILIRAMILVNINNCVHFSIESVYM